MHSAARFSICRFRIAQVRRNDLSLEGDSTLFEAIGRGEFTINGFRDRDLRALLLADANAPKADQRGQAAAVSRDRALTSWVIVTALMSMRYG